MAAKNSRSIIRNFSPDLAYGIHSRNRRSSLLFGKLVTDMTNLIGSFAPAYSYRSRSGQNWGHIEWSHHDQVCRDISPYACYSVAIAPTQRYTLLYVYLLTLAPHWALNSARTNAPLAGTMLTTAFSDLRYVLTMPHQVRFDFPIRSGIGDNCISAPVSFQPGAVRHTYFLRLVLQSAR